MQFSFSFFFHFLFSFVGFLLIGIYLCRGSWRNMLHQPWDLGLAFILAGHLAGLPGPISLVTLALLTGGLFALWFFRTRSAPSEVRAGHNVFSLLAGAALFALTIQLHSVLFGIPVFQLVK